MARRCDAVDRFFGFRIGRDEVLEIRFPEHEQPAIGQRRDVRVTRPARKQSHFAEEFPATEPHWPRRERHLDRAGSNKKDGVTPVSLADDALVRYCKPWA